MGLLVIFLLYCLEIVRYIYIYVESSCNEDIYDQLSSKYQLSFLNSYSNVLVYIFFHFILEVGILENNMRMQIDACLYFRKKQILLCGQIIYKNSDQNVF